MAIRFRIGVAIAGTAIFLATAAAVVTSDSFVRRMVRSVLSRTLRGPSHLESASFSFSEGLVVRGLVVLDPNDPTGPPAVEVETLRMDYEVLPTGDAVRVTSVVLERPVIRVRRLADGTLSVGALLQPIRPDAVTPEPPAIRIENGRFSYSDPDAVAGEPLELTGATATAIPAGGSWRFDLTGTNRELGEVRARATIDAEGEGTSEIDVPAMPLGPDLFRRLRLPAAAHAVEVGVQGRVPLHVAVTWGPGRAPDVDATLKIAGATASIVLPETAPGAPPPRALQVTASSGEASLGDGVVVVRDLELRALGATLRCAEATFAGLDGDRPPTVCAGLEVEGLVLDGGVHAYLPHAVRRVLEAYSMAGCVSASASVRGPLSAPEVTAEATVTDGRLRYEGYLRPDGIRRGFAWDVTGVGATVNLVEGPRVVLVAEGRHGTARVRAEGELDYRTGEEIPRIDIVGEEVPLDQDLRAAFQDRAETIFDRWTPAGVARRIEVGVRRDPHVDGPSGETVPVRIELDGRATVRPRAFPMTLRGVTGSVDVLYPAEGDRRIERVALHDVRAQGDGISFALDGRVDTDRDVTREDFRLHVSVEEAAGPVGEAIAASVEFIPPAVRSLVGELGLGGAFDLDADIFGDADRRADRFVASLRGASVSGWRDVPFASSGMTGTVVVEGDEARIEDLRCTALGVPVSANGRLLGIAAGDVEPDVTVEAQGLQLGDPLRRALGPVAEKASELWDRLGPVGEEGVRGTRADVSLRLRPSADPTPVVLRLSRLSGPLRPLGIDLDLSDGELTYDSREVVARAEASAGGAALHVRRIRFEVVTGRVEVDADVRGMRFPEDVESLFSEATAASLVESFPGRALDATDLQLTWEPSEHRLDLTGDLVLAPRTRRDARGPGLRPAGLLTVDRFTLRMPPGLPVQFDGTVRPQGFSFDPGIAVTGLDGTVALLGRIDDGGAEVAAQTQGARLSVADQPLSDATVDVLSNAGGVSVNASAAYRGGTLTAEFRPGDGRPAYTALLRLRGADLARIAGPESDMKGTVDAEVRLRNPTGEADALRGTVVATVKEGDLGRFPVFSAIWDVVSMATLFLLPTGDLREGRLEGGILGGEIRVNLLEISGPILRLHDASGTVGLDGRLAVNLSAFLGFPPISVPIHVAGTVGDPEVGLMRREERPPEDGR